VSFSVSVIQILNGLSFSLLLFLTSAGLSISFGLLNLANLAHGGFYMLGGYFALALLARNFGFWFALFGAPLLVGLIGLFIEIFLLRAVYRRDHLDQVLLTIGIAYFIWDFANWTWGGTPYFLSIPRSLDYSISIFGRGYPMYRLFVLLAGLLLACLLIWVEAGTRIGSVIRAGVTDPEMLRAMGINVTLVFSLVFSFGALLAGFGGVIGGPIIGLYPGVDFEILMLAVAVVVVGGLGSLRGTLLSSILIGMVDSLGRVYFPEFSLVMIFGLMGLVLLVRPSGLFGVDRGIMQNG
jgi:branched-chain amino acid transport system permease protein